MKGKLLWLLENSLEWLSVRKKLCLFLAFVSLFSAISTFVNAIVYDFGRAAFIFYGKMMLASFFLILFDIFVILWKGNDGWDKRGNRKPDLPPDPKLAKDLIEEIIKSAQEKFRRKQDKKEPALL